MSKAQLVAKTVRVGVLSLELRKYADGRFGFDYSPPGEDRIKVRLRTIAKAEERAKEILGAARGGKLPRFVDDPDLFAEFLLWKARQGDGALVPALVKSFKAMKGGKKLSHHTTRILFADLDAFADAFPGKIEALSRGAVEKWIDGLSVGPRRWNNVREHLVSLWKFARREGAITAAVHGPEMIERKKVSYQVETYTPDEFDAYLKATPGEWLPSLVLMALCGIRPMELFVEVRHAEPKPTLRWENFLWDRCKVDVPAEVAKDRRRRFVPLCAAALVLLAGWRDAKGFIAPREDAYKFTGKWAKAAGVKWKKDGWRHSYASYRLAVTQNVHALADEMGNSVHMIRTHYLDRKHEDEAHRWFRVRKVPKSVGSDSSETHKTHRKISRSGHVKATI